MRAPGLETVTAAAVVAKTDSGARVVKILAQDEDFYWTKFAHSDHGPEAVAFEVIATILGRELGAPIPDAALVQVPVGLENETDYRGHRIGASLGFGSLAVEGYELEQPNFVKNDGNPDGLPLLLALTELCMGDDEQFLVEPGADNRVYGFDFDSWFAGTHPGWQVSWFATDINDSYISDTWRNLEMNRDSLLDARSAVTRLDPATFDAAVAAVPAEWNVQGSQLRSLAQLLNDRKRRVITTFDEILSSPGR